MAYLMKRETHLSTVLRKALPVLGRGVGRIQASFLTELQPSSVTGQLGSQLQEPSVTLSCESESELQGWGCAISPRPGNLHTQQGGARGAVALGQVGLL